MDSFQKPNCFLSALFTEILLEHNVFYIVERKERFSLEKTVVQKRTKNGHFPNGLVHGFCPKIKFFCVGVFYRNYVRKNGF